MVCCENELENIFKKLIKYKFSPKNEINYIILRYMILNKINKVNKIDKINFLQYLLKEINLPNNIIYNGLLINNFSTYETSLINIINNWFLDLEKNMELIIFKEYLENCYKEILKTSLKENLRYKETSYYKEILLLSNLNNLNKFFEVTICKDLLLIENIYYPDNFKASIIYEDILNEKISILKKYDTTIIFSEKEIETFLKNHLNKIEDGLILVQTQFAIKDALIDILAKDKNGNTVIIELKIKDDERLIWQNIYYPKQYKIEHPNEKVRMLSISPYYSNYILSALEELKDVEVYTYYLDYNNDDILDITIRKKDL